MPRKIDLSGRRFFRWTVLSRDEGRYWFCKCDCGTERAVHQSSLSRGVTQSCGCWRQEVSRKMMQEMVGQPGWRGNNGATRIHGEAIARTPEYRTWISMHERCRNKDRADYGGRGIAVCERWKSFENFLADMGRRPSKLLSLDRIDNDLGYSPDNCRWATKKEQQVNRRKFARIERFTIDELLAEIARRPVCCIPYLSLPA